MFFCFCYFFSVFTWHTLAFFRRYPPTAALGLARSLQDFISFPRPWFFVLRMNERPNDDFLKVQLDVDTSPRQKPI